MNTALIAFCRALVADPRSLRAIEETALDWKVECREAPSAFARAWCHVQSALALARVLSGSLPREIHQGRWLVVAARALVLAVVPALLFATVTFGMSLYRPPSALQVTEMVLSLVPACMAMVLPFACMLALARRGSQSVSTVAAIPAVFFGMLALLTLVVPVGNNHFSDLMWQVVNPDPRTAQPNLAVPGPILWGIFDDRPSGLAWHLVVRDLRFALFASIAAFFGCQAARLGGRRSTLALLAAILPVSVVATTPIWAMSMSPMVIGWFARYLLLVHSVVLLVAAVLMARSTGHSVEATSVRST